MIAIVSERMDEPSLQVERNRHFKGLDGLRGFAALAVVLMHRRFWLDLPRDFHGGLAVDFFFMLSGFVIAHAYGQQLAERRLSFSEFARLRLIRLYPLLFLGAAMATGAELFDNWRDGELDKALTALAAFPFNALALPTWFNPGNPFNPNFPAWSLFFEIIANFTFALCVAQLSLRHLRWLTAFCGLILLVLIMTSADFLRVGTSWATLASGLVRVAFPTCAGVLIQRLHQAGRLRVPSLNFGALVIILLAVIFIPISYNRLLERLYLGGVLFVVLPLIIASAAAAEPSSRWTRLVHFSGFVSYPLYILHVPILLWLDHVAYLGGVPGPTRLLVVVLAAIGFSWLAGRFFDLPLRQWLAARHRRRPAEVP